MIMEKKTVRENQNSGRTLVNIDLYLKNGIHIGTKYKNGPMRKFVFKSRNDKINVMDVQGIDKRIKMAIDFISKYEPQDVVFISRKKYALPGVKILEQSFGYKSKLNRFIPGTFTNPESEHFIEPKLIFIADPNVDRQAIVEATTANIPVIGLCTTSSNTRNVDFIIPYNNKGRKSVALFFWILIRELQLKNGAINSDKDYAYNIEDLIYNNESGEKEIDDETGSRKRVRRVSTKVAPRRGSSSSPARRPTDAPRRPYVRRAPIISPPATTSADSTTSAPTTSAPTPVSVKEKRVTEVKAE